MGDTLYELFVQGSIILIGAVTVSKFIDYIGF